MKPAVDYTVQSLLETKLSQIENYFKSDVLTYYGPIVDGNENTLLNIVETLAKTKEKKTNF
jgi:hypothetical protein